MRRNSQRQHKLLLYFKIVQGLKGEKAMDENNKFDENNNLGMTSGMSEDQAVHPNETGKIEDIVDSVDIEEVKEETQQSVGGYSMNGHSAGTQYNFWQSKANPGQQGMPSMNHNYENPYGGPYMQNPNMVYPPKKEKKKRDYKVLKWIGKAAAVGVVAGIGFCIVVFGATKLGLIQIGNKAGTNEVRGISATVTTTDEQVAAPNDLTEVVSKCMPSIVSINSTITTTTNTFYGSYSQDVPGSGSGIILKISDDEILIVTNNHVIADAKKILIGFNGAEKEEDMVQAVVKGTDSTRDLAVVLVKKKDVPEEELAKIQAAEIGSSDDSKVGEMAIAIGNALGYGQSMTVGYISAKDRVVQVDDTTTMQLLQTDAAINPGNSGGALLNAEGKLIGINSAKYADTTVEGMGFAIPISDAISVINDLMDREVLSEEEKGYLGVQGTDITEAVQQSYPNMPLGFYVSALSENGAAEKAGIMVGDIIVGVNGEEITTGKALVEKVNSYKIGTKVKVAVKRYESGKYNKKEIEVTLMAKADTGFEQEEDQNQGSTQNNNSNNDQQQNNNPAQEQPDYSVEDEMEQYFNEFFGR